MKCRRRKKHDIVRDSNSCSSGIRCLVQPLGPVKPNLDDSSKDNNRWNPGLCRYRDRIPTSIKISISEILRQKKSPFWLFEHWFWCFVCQLLLVWRRRQQRRRRRQRRRRLAMKTYFLKEVFDFGFFSPATNDFCFSRKKNFFALSPKIVGRTQWTGRQKMWKKLVRSKDLDKDSDAMRRPHCLRLP